ncbi:MAG: glucan biosynthesis protein, partial [Clostridia bacterium]|nr:glucan biosynthesis protein [Deltaproteobacteria bacterium]
MRYLVLFFLAVFASPAQAVTFGPKTPFDYAALIARAERASKSPYTPPGNDHDEALKTLTGDVASTIYFKSENALWANEKGAPQIRFFHRMTWFRERL